MAVEHGRRRAHVDAAPRIGARVDAGGLRHNRAVEVQPHTARRARAELAREPQAHLGTGGNGRRRDRQQLLQVASVDRQPAIGQAGDDHPQLTRYAGNAENDFLGRGQRRRLEPTPEGEHRPTGKAAHVLDAVAAGGRPGEGGSAGVPVVTVDAEIAGDVPMVGNGRGRVVNRRVVPDRAHSETPGFISSSSSVQVVTRSESRSCSQVCGGKNPYRKSFTVGLGHTTHGCEGPTDPRRRAS
jgi:hypothetical protein